jgi:hypothetical protein
VLDPRFVFVAIALAGVGSFRYVRDTWRGVTAPHRVTWTLWAAEGILAFLVELQAHVGLAAAMTLMLGLAPFAVLIASFRNPQAVWKIDRVDVACGLVAVAGLVFWLLEKEATVALVAFTAADYVAALPTYRKAWASPESETASMFVLGAVNCAITLMTLRHFTTSGALFPGAITFTDTILSVMILGRLGPKWRARSAGLASV